MQHAGALTRRASQVRPALAFIKDLLTHPRPLWGYLGMALVARELALAPLYLRGCVLGQRVRVVGRPVVRRRGGGQIVLGERVRIISRITPCELAADSGARLQIGAGTHINYGSSLGATGLVQIGERCMFGCYVNVIDNDFHDLAERTRRPEPRPVLIEDEVWLGNHVIVLPGVRIGRGAVVAAGSVVHHDIAPWSVAVGNPARVVRKLTPPPAEPEAVAPHTAAARDVADAAHA
jgi:acetyltransferase-like isoleucine patch superfamily enzyme